MSIHEDKRDIEMQVDILLSIANDLDRVGFEKLSHKIMSCAYNIDEYAKNMMEYHDQFNREALRHSQEVAGGILGVLVKGLD